MTNTKQVSLRVDAETDKQLKELQRYLKLNQPSTIRYLINKHYREVFGHNGGSHEQPKQGG
jgi:predicted DNA-binding protein